MKSIAWQRSPPTLRARMPSRPVIFISAVSKELHSTRDLVAKVLLSLGYEPVWQDLFGMEEGTVKDMLHRKIAAAQGLIQLVGHCYGAEPASAAPPFGRVSYTQYEALHARQQGQRVWYLLLEENFPADAHEAESLEHQQLQSAYRQRIRGAEQLYHQACSPLEIENRVLRLRDDLSALRDQMLASQQQQEQKLTHLLDAQQQGLAAVQELHLMLDSFLKGGSEAKLNEDYDTALRIVSARHALEPEILRQLIAERTDRTLSDPQADLRQKVQALREAGRFIEARDFALEHARRLQTARQQATLEEFELWMEASDSEHALGHYAKTEEYAAKAESLCDREEDFVNWAIARHRKTSGIMHMGRYDEARVLCEELIALRTERFGRDHLDTLHSRMGRATILYNQGHFVEAETEYRAGLVSLKMVRGDHHKDTLLCRMMLANVLDDTDRSAEAEAEHRAIIAIKEEVLGPEHFDTLLSRLNLIIALAQQNKHQEAEVEAEVTWRLAHRVMGPESPVTLSTRKSLALAWHGLGRHQEAEDECRKIRVVQERVFGPEHPRILRTRMALAEILFAQGRTEEAVAEHRALIPVQERVLGLGSPDVLWSCYELARCLESQGKLPEALALAQRAEAGSRKLFGDGLSGVRDAEQLRQRVEAALQQAR